MNIKKNVMVPLICLVILLPCAVFTQGLRDAASNLGNIGQQVGVEEQGELGTVVGRLINGALTLVGLLFLLLMVYAGYIWMTARGEEEKVNKAKGILTAAVIGLVIVVSAYAITAFVTGRFE